MKSMDLSVVIVSYNTCNLTLECLQSVYRETFGIDFEVIVVDNASSDGSPDAISSNYPSVHLLRIDNNIGFAQANNLAIKEALGRSILLLNPDTVVLDGAIQKLLGFARSHPEAGICGGRTLFADRSLNPDSCFGKPTVWSSFCFGLGLSSIFKKNRWFNPEGLGGWSRNTVREVDIVTGCFFLIRKDLWNQLGGFDPLFFMYGEEVDFCLRASKQGHKCLFCPDATIIHYYGASQKIRVERMILIFRSRTLLFMKHWGGMKKSMGVFSLKVWALSRVIVFFLLAKVGSKWMDSYYNWLEIWTRRNEWVLPLQLEA